MLSYKSKLLIYNGLVKPHTEYCALAWMDKLNKQQMEVLTKLQKRAIRLVFYASSEFPPNLKMVKPFTTYSKPGTQVK